MAGKLSDRLPRGGRQLAVERRKQVRSISHRLLGNLDYILAPPTANCLYLKAKYPLSGDLILSVPGLSLHKRPNARVKNITTEIKGRAGSHSDCLWALLRENGESAQTASLVSINFRIWVWVFTQKDKGHAPLMEWSSSFDAWRNLTELIFPVLMVH